MSCAYERHGDSQAGVSYPEITESLLEVAENLHSSALALQRMATMQQRAQGSEKVRLGKQELGLQNLTASGSAAEQGRHLDVPPLPAGHPQSACCL